MKRAKLEELCWVVNRSQLGLEVVNLPGGKGVFSMVCVRILEKAPWAARSLPGPCGPCRWSPGQCWVHSGFSFIPILFAVGFLIWSFCFPG